MTIADKARKIPGVAAAQGAVTGAVTSEQDLPIADYDKRTATNIAAKLKPLSQRELRMVGAYEAKHENRGTVIGGIAKLTEEEPWSGYDGQNIPEITARLAGRTAETAGKVRSYELAHKERAGVLDITARNAGTYS
jgi:hypothetical protein